MHTNPSNLTRLLLFVSCLSAFALSMAPAAAADVVAVEVRDVSDFTGVVFSGSGNLYITQGAHEGLTIRAEQKVLDVITTEVRGGVLSIGRKKGSSVHSREEIRFELSVKTLERLGMSGSGDVFAEKLEADELNISISGSSDVTLGEILVDELRMTISGSGELAVADLDTNHLGASISGSGTIGVEGRCDTQEVTVSGSGDFLAASLESNSAKATVVGSGKVEIWATKALDVTVTGSGDVRYRGNPEISMQVQGSGNVKALGR